ncbi:MAG: Cytochrome c555 [Candidatus Accumulibacter regalis]|jgi:cytochrome c5|uniref:Cytochrome c555 n=2 Tax=Candidatus Accumulibacter TaxID=327159 RepID=A0A011QQ66_ACCRE|nr:MULTISPECIES: c-type cytochrome [unclassified Candidatus Accumulibacter]EXI78944.1 MAG: Cytochrome c555 [Candidatus Accumulibacter appositus]EXI91260.1 MAG: Cytochrome c555 [Candidatus Accumulibacter regalis]MQM35888.1 cytochrome C [Candidatus Accumulibacter phosphatis]MBL8368570.1 cytochrome c5 family protein [Accumulibacter sp.]MBN8515130.1 cytochrome c5 family protein [Accumulibacter sp.]
MAQKQFSSRTILVITIVIAVLLMVVIWPLSMIGKGSAQSASDADAIYARILPVAKLAYQKPAATAAAGEPRSGEAVYKAVCMACHASGAAGAPKAGDKEAWAPRIATGTDALVASATNGKGAMPPKGGAADLTDDEIKAAVEHLLGLVK